MKEVKETLICVIRSVVGGEVGGGDCDQCHKVECCWWRRWRRRLWSVL